MASVRFTTGTCKRASAVRMESWARCTAADVGVTAPIGGSATVLGLGAGAVGCWATSGNVVTTLATKNTNALTRTLLLLGSVPGEAVVLRGPALERGLLVVGEDLHDIGANESAQAIELGTHRIPHRSHGRVPLVQD